MSAVLDAPPVAAIDRLLEAARRRLNRLEPLEAARLAHRGEALLVDVRPLEQRRRDGRVPLASIVPRNVLEWRLDPTSPHRLPGFDDPVATVVVICDEGYQSSLAAATLQDLGLPNATDLVGGVQAWLAAGLVTMAEPRTPGCHC